MRGWGEGGGVRGDGVREGGECQQGSTPSRFALHKPAQFP